jgi:tetratricopeptide (TPR) repeat protein
LQNEVAMLNFVTGFASLWRNDLQRSEHYFQLGLSQAIRLEDAVLQSRFLAYIPVLYRKQNDVEQTRSRADESLKFSTAINMKEYIAIAKANLGWAHLRSGEVTLAKQECTEAVEIWRSLPLVSPFQELALWPLIAIALQEQDIAAAIAHAGAILDPSQRQLEQGVESLLKRALTSPVEEARDFLQQAVEIVRTGGYVDSGTKETD